jgi:hypothetical protein
MMAQTVSDKQGISIIALFLLGTNFIVATAGATKKDAWLATSKGAAKIFGFRDYRFIISPVALSVIAFSFILFENMQEVIGWIQLNIPIFNFTFTILTVFLTYFRAELHYRKNIRLKRN